jgi:hypothetical protein
MQLIESAECLLIAALRTPNEAAFGFISFISVLIFSLNYIDWNISVLIFSLNYIDWKHICCGRGYQTSGHFSLLDGSTSGALLPEPFLSIPACEIKTS